MKREWKRITAGVCFTTPNQRHGEGCIGLEEPVLELQTLWMLRKIGLKNGLVCWLVLCRLFIPYCNCDKMSVFSIL